MHYPVIFRRKVLNSIKEGMKKREAARLFKISPNTVYEWLKREDDLSPRLSTTRCRKIDKEKLRAHIKAYPHMLLRERAEIFGVTVSGLSYALKAMGIVKKTRDGMWSDAICKDKNISANLES